MRFADAKEDFVGFLFVVGVGRGVSILQHLEKFGLFRVPDQTLLESRLERSLGGRHIDSFILRKVDSQRFPAKFKGEFKTLKHCMGLNRRWRRRHGLRKTADGLGKFRECEVKFVARR